MQHLPPHSALAHSAEVAHSWPAAFLVTQAVPLQYDVAAQPVEPAQDVPQLAPAQLNPPEQVIAGGVTHAPPLHMLGAMELFPEQLAGLPQAFVA